MSSLRLIVGVKADPIEYRYSYAWLFRLMASEGIRHLQFGSFLELYQLPDDYFRRVRSQAEDFGISICSMLTSHRELGGFFRPEPEWPAVARRSYERYIEVGALLGARSVGSNPGSVPRDQMGTKAQGTACYLRHMKELMAYAYRKGVGCLTMEPMSCLAEPPTLPDEIRAMADELNAFHKAHPHSAVAGYCTDVSHGYLDQHGKTCWDHMQLLEACLPYTYELHLRNTGANYESTFGFTEAERKKGIVRVEAVRDLLLRKADVLPSKEIVGHLEIGGPKLGRDYSDGQLEGMLRESLRYLKKTFATEAGETPAPRVRRAHAGLLATGATGNSAAGEAFSGTVKIAPSVMCADLCHLEDSVRHLERLQADFLHMDIMDAHFTPNMPLGLETLRQLRPKTAVPFDVHLMVNNNDFFIRQAAEVGAQWVSFHFESAVHADRSLALIRDLGMKAGLALNPATPVSALLYVLERLDFVLLMTVNPGFAGQKAVPSAIQKIKDCRAFLDSHGLAIPIEVDGNVSFENIPLMVRAGAGILVAGSSSVFDKAGSLAANFAKMREAIGNGLTMRGKGMRGGGRNARGS
ncbi:MAG: ribulose-phosphate 3-epimerase [Planctomycetota bacterium]|nr:ribulose-phosphate 3-epimerase [Planctomycetota bacterium]